MRRRITPWLRRRCVAASRSGRSRSSLREDCAFQAAYNYAQHDLRRELETRLPHLAKAALEAVAAAVQEGDVRAALAVLKGLGALSGSGPKIGSEDPDELAEEKQLAEQERAAHRSLRESFGVESPEEYEVLQLIRSGDYDTVEVVMKPVHLATIGPEDPEALAEEKEIAEREAASIRSLRRLTIP